MNTQQNIRKDDPEYWIDKIVSLIAIGCMCFVIARFNVGVLHVKSVVLSGWQARISIILIIMFFTATNPTSLKKPLSKRLLGLLITMLMYTGSSIFKWWNDYMVFFMMALWLIADYFLAKRLENIESSCKETDLGDNNSK